MITKSTKLKDKITNTNLRILEPTNTVKSNKKETMTDNKPVIAKANNIRITTTTLFI